MKKRQSSIDGFVPRRSGEQLGDLHRQTPAQATETIAKRQLHTGDRLEHSLQKEESPRLSRSEINASLRDIDQPLDDKKLTRRQRRKANKKPMTRRRRIIKWTIIGILVLMLAAGGYFAFKAFSTGSKIFKGNILDAFTQNVPLKQDSNGRSNILIFGTAEDDEGGQHSGGNLTDSIMVLSVDQTRKDAYMVSLPRDLWVQYAETCTVGNQGKLNAAYFCASDDGTNEDAGSQALRTKAGEITGLDVQYSVHMNFKAVVEAVNAVGGVDVTVDSEDPRGVFDPIMDWRCNNQCHFVDYKQGERAHMDGDHALAFARARNSEGGYGLPRGNFDREKNQQKVLMALREKAVSAGTLTNFGAVTGLMDALGNNLHTNFDAKEIRTLMALGNDIKNDQVKSISLVDEGAELVTTGNVGGQSIVRPVAGLYDYTAIQAHIREEVSNDPVTKEKAGIEVLNGSQTPGVAQKQADKLNEQGLIVSDVGNAPEGQYDKVAIYQIGTGNPATAAKLKAVYGVEIKATAPPFQVVGDAKFVVVFGADPDASNQ